MKKNNLYNKYTVKDGDTLYAISRKFNINPVLLALINGLNLNDYIYSNQEILIPRSEYSFYLTKNGDNLNDVLDLFNVTYKDFIEYNDTILLDENQLFAYKR